MITEKQLSYTSGTYDLCTSEYVTNHNKTACSEHQKQIVYFQETQEKSHHFIAIYKSNNEYYFIINNKNYSCGINIKSH